MNRVVLGMVLIMAVLAAMWAFGEETVSESSEWPVSGTLSSTESREPLASSEYHTRYVASHGEAPPFDEPVGDEIYRMIRELVQGRLGEAKRSQMEERLVTAMEAADLGDAALRDHAARLAVADLLKNAALFMPKNREQDPAFVAQQDRVIRSLASSFAARLSRQVPGMVISGIHAGSLLSPVIDVKLPAGYEKVPWALLSGFEYEEFTPIPDVIKAESGKAVGIVGYMITLSETEDIREFLLVESLWTCCFGVPPDVHQVVVVRVKGDGVDATTDPLLILGRLEVGEETEDGFVTSIYRLHAERVKELE